MIKKQKWGLLGIGLLLTAALFFSIKKGKNQAAADGSVDGQETAVAFIGNLSESATASGTIEAGRDATLSLARAGIVETIETAVGDVVSSGDLLVQLETAALERAVLSAQADVAIAQANLENGIDGASDAAIAAAQAQLDSANARLNSVINGATDEEIAASEAAVKAAEARVWSASGNLSATNEVSDADILAAQADLDAALEAQESAHNIWVMLADCEENADGTHSCTPSDSDRMDSATQQAAAADAQVALMQARLDNLSNPDSNSVASSQAGIASASAQYDAAVARHNALLADATEAEIASARADVASAESNLHAVLDGATETEILILETRLAQAKTGLAEAENALADAQLLAPFDGVVTAVYLNEGEMATGRAMQIVDNNSLEVVLSVDEIDVGNVRVGQEAVITLETWPDVEIESVVTAVAPSAAANNNGIIAYDVHLSLGAHDLPILVGMTANADLITANREDVLLVPNATLTADRENGTYSVNLVTTGADGERVITAVEVTVGLQDNQYSQITSGIVEGDELLVGELVVPIETFNGPPRR